MRVASVSKLSRNAVYLTTLSISGAQQCRTVAWMSTDEWEVTLYGALVVRDFYFSLRMRHQVFRNATLCRWISCSRRFGISWMLFPSWVNQLQGKISTKQTVTSQNNLNRFKYRCTNHESHILCQNLVSESEENNKIGQSGQQLTRASPRYKPQASTTERNREVQT